MSILDTDKIDTIATKPDSNVVKLVIADHLDWVDADEHCVLLQEKINTYIEFVESGQLKRTKQPPIPENEKIVITLAALCRPSPAGMEFLSKVKVFLAEINLAFEIEIRPMELNNGRG